MSTNDDELAKEVETLHIHAQATQRQAERLRRLIDERKMAETTVSISEAARQLGYTRQTVSKWVQEGKIHTSRLKRIPLTEIARLRQMRQKV